MSEIELLPEQEPTDREVVELADKLLADNRILQETGTPGRFGWAYYVAFARACLRAQSRRSPPQVGRGMEEMKWSLQAAQAELRRLPSPNVYGALHKLEDIIRALSPPSDGEDKGK